MADTISRYNHTSALFLNGGVDLNNLAIMLLTGAATFNAANTTLDQVAGAVSGGHRPREVYGNGWDEGGEAFAVTVTTVEGSGAMLDGTDIEVTATGGDIGPTEAYIIIDKTNSRPLWFIDLDAPRTANEGTPFKITVNALGVYRILNA
ncbi:hypothetical protein [Devosia sp. 63-57]|uniref:hypothetical protein n=1 Tax=Devosia sp. 63-57 TaxID=1895751 RepID=UPI00086DD8B2|nr:hypothetical protein [Devosia sp. 63-57]ODT50254.1 MAG: hypothetical protein ABS74_04880 [Pelagibacterium sp. SCN 63-126]ODU83021.1 MAG: hypothetical protein ABT14_16185 [Pelagibacterium sp. SCN 63-17]OJX44998.1 MAG: hypothetical protein BGO80_03880 [Devosia sp. 63-57]